MVLRNLKLLISFAIWMENLIPKSSEEAQFIVQTSSTSTPFHKFFAGPTHTHWENVTVKVSKEVENITRIKCLKPSFRIDIFVRYNLFFRSCQ